MVGTRVSSWQFTDVTDLKVDVYTFVTLIT